MNKEPKVKPDYIYNDSLERFLYIPQKYLYREEKPDKKVVQKEINKLDKSDKSIKKNN